MSNNTQTLRAANAPLNHENSTLEVHMKPLSELIAERDDEIEYLRKHIKEMDLIFGKNLLAMRCAIIEAEHGEGHKAGLLWIFNTLFGPGEFAPDEETDAQAYFNRESEIIDKELSEVYDWYRERRKRIEAQEASHG